MNLDITKPTVGGSSDTWGTELNAVIDSFDDAILTDNFAEDSDNHSGLDFYYKAGRIRTGTSVNNVAAGHVTLADDDTSYVEVAANGTVSDNITGFTAGSFPLFTIVTAAGKIGLVTDKRCYNQVLNPASQISGTANEITVTDDGDGTVTLSLPVAIYLGTSGKIGRDADNLIDFATDNQIMFRINGTDNIFKININGGTEVISSYIDTDDQAFIINTEFATTTSDTNNYIGLYVTTAGSYISNTKTNSGYHHGAQIYNATESTGFQGTLTENCGLIVSSGIYSCGANAVLTTNYGIRSVVYDNDSDGVITTSYMFHGSINGSAGKITNNWGLYCNDEDKNYLSAGLLLSGAILETNGTESFSIKQATDPTTSTADQISIFATAGANCTLGLRTEVAVAAEVDETKFSHKLAVKINGSDYYIMLTDS